jgi:serine/threonine-protein kinase
MSLEPGVLVGNKYRVERLLGEGGMGAVYVTTNVMTQAQVALKVMHEQLRDRGELARRFLQEAPTASKIRHPGVVRVFDAGQDGDLLWMAMELLEGESLAQRLERGPISRAELEDVFAQLLDILAEVHREGIVHRDLKPANVFLERDYKGQLRVRLLDFGIAKLSGNQLGTYATQLGVFMGSLGYMAPEQMMEAKDVDARADIYALGVMLYQCLTNALPYDAETFGELIAKQHKEPIKPLQPSADVHLQQYGRIALACLAVPRDQRPANVAELQRMFAEAAAEGQTSASHAPSLPAEPATKRSWIKWSILGALLALGALATAVALLGRDVLTRELQVESYSAPAPLPSTPSKPPVKKAPAPPPLTLAEQRERSCQQGTMKDCLALAFTLETGTGVAKDRARAITLFRRACDGGDLAACRTLGNRYQDGNGVRADATQGLALLIRACDGSEPLACFQIGLMYEFGNGVRKDRAQAASMYKRACSVGWKAACERATKL